MMLDHQRRDDDTGFQQNGDTGKRVHVLLGWDKLAPESMAMYQSGPGYYRVASKPAAEARMWMIAGIAGGIQPWWHHVGAYHEDRRMYRSAEPVMRWWQGERAIPDRPDAGRDGRASCGRSETRISSVATTPADRVDAPYTGFMHALVRARIPYLPASRRRHRANSGNLRMLILPNVGALSDAQAPVDSTLRPERRLAGRDRPHRPLQRVGRSEARFCAGGSVRDVTRAATRRGCAEQSSRRCRPTGAARSRRAPAVTPTCG